MQFSVKKADMLPQEGLRELQSGECLELLEGPKEETHRCFHGWEKRDGNICDYGEHPSTFRYKGISCFANRQTIEAQPKSSHSALNCARKRSRICGAHNRRNIKGMSRDDSQMLCLHAGMLGYGRLSKKIRK